MEHEELLSVIEAILFAAGDPVPASRIALVTGEETQTIVSAARELAAAYEENRCGMRLVQMNDLLQLCSAPEYAEYIRRALEHSAVLEPVSVIERMQYALEHLFDHNICRVAGFDLFIYALQRRNDILRKRYLQILI